MREVAAELSSARCCCSAAARTRSCCCAWPRRRSARRRFPFPLMHVDTGHNFPEVIEFRDRRVAELGERLIVASVQESIDRGRVVEETGPRASRNRLQTTTLLDAIERARLRRRLRRRAPRRGARPGQGADLLLPRRLRPVGPAAPAPRAVEHLQRAHPPRRARPRVPDLATGPSSTSGSTSPRRTSRSRRSTSPTSARSSAATGCSTRSRRTCELIDGEEPFTDSVRYRTVGDMSCTGAVALDARRRCTTSWPRSRRRRSPSAARRAPTTASPRPRWRTARSRGTSNGASQRNGCPACCGRTSCASRPPARSTTASRR